VNVFRKARVIGGGEGKIVAQGEAPRRHAERTLGRDVQHIGVELADARGDATLWKQGQPDLRVGRTRQRAEFERSEEPHLVPHRVKFTCRGLERAHHAVDLWLPGISDEQDSQECLLTS
jgi:hypothetical protein